MNKITRINSNHSMIEIYFNDALDRDGFAREINLVGAESYKKVLSVLLTNPVKYKELIKQLSNNL